MIWHLPLVAQTGGIAPPSKLEMFYPQRNNLSAGKRLPLAIFIWRNHMIWSLWFKEQTQSSTQNFQLFFILDSDLYKS